VQNTTARINGQKPPFIAAGNQRCHDLAAYLGASFRSPNDGDAPRRQKTFWKQGVPPLRRAAAFHGMSA
jgi:hypothetical protein